MAKRKIKLVSWNVNGLRAVMGKGFLETFKNLDADVVGIQETKLQAPQVTGDMANIEGYTSYWAHATTKKGYSGVAAFSRMPVKNAKTGMGREEYDNEGRIVELDLGDFIFFNIYFPNGQMGEDRLTYKLDFYRDFFAYADAYRKQGRSLVICGDYNTAHNEIDLKNPKANENTSGFMRIERDWLDKISADGYVDTFRHLYPDTVKYSWWTYRFKARERNVGWRIDYFFVTEDIISKGWLKDAFIDNTVYGSDHCPVGLVLEI
ncbi:exodeoxyribonuclease III [Desulfosudis oleivorans]|uniref:Exodeoxyribonuclease III n=1 Tax=Desulfosudis oleivorans (strain DSM 6200 / JCM 39069 / Hxd3) TaxID=96561 RepID=A8ZWN1_DESOH|nr:exodeoxyribonuclease III [Desulfosudis oleivorans]ABW68362.1 exodeoxyribonuclease III [Desulfosudis oleivorans Hxd3]